MSKTFEESVNVSRETWVRLRQYGDIVRKWQKTINLISPTTVSDLWDRHVLDSLQIWALDPKPKTWLDMGSGAGFPGIVTAICLAEHGSGWVYLIESNQKKAAFLRNVIVETGARASVHPVRVVDAFDIAPEIEAISARALASLDDLLEMSEPWFKQNQNLSTYLHKGRDYQLEIELARSRWDFNLVKYDSQIQDGSVILQIDGLKRL